MIGGSGSSSVRKGVHRLIHRWRRGRFEPGVEVVG